MWSSEISFKNQQNNSCFLCVCVWVFSSLYKPLSKNAFLSTSPTAKSGKVRQVNLPQGTLSAELQGAFDTEGIQSKIELPLGQYVHVAFWSLLPSDFKKKKRAYPKEDGMEGHSNQTYTVYNTIITIIENKYTVDPMFLASRVQKNQIKLQLSMSSWIIVL